MKPQMTAADLLMLIQHKQLEHDESYHREIARLPIIERLQHMALHISKYFARIVQSEVGGTHSGSAWLDTFIISVSISNILNKRLSDLWNISDEVSSGEISDWLRMNSAYSDDREELLLAFAQSAESLSNACEKMDHLESFDYRATLHVCVKQLSQLSAAELVGQHELFDVVESRLSDVKCKSIFHEA